jgi:hypothetical protein
MTRFESCFFFTLYIQTLRYVHRNECSHMLSFLFKCIQCKCVSSNSSLDKINSIKMLNFYYNYLLSNGFCARPNRAPALILSNSLYKVCNHPCINSLLYIFFFKSTLNLHLSVFRSFSFNSSIFFFQIFKI